MGDNFNIEIRLDSPDDGSLCGVLRLRPACTAERREMKSDNTGEFTFPRVAGAANLRDMGGGILPDGRKIKTGLVFRSDDLHALDAERMDAVAALGLKTVVDFRSPEEQVTCPDHLPDEKTKLVALPLMAGNVIQPGELAAADGSLAMQRIYTFFVHDAQAEYRTFFSLLQQPENLPLLFHCSAGKDRTGFAAAVFLAALGAPWEMILADYLASAEAVGKKYAGLLAARPQLAPLFGVEERYLRTSFDGMKAVGGSVENYLTTYLNVDLPLMHRLYTQA